jgi:hypothetical protein
MVCPPDAPPPTKPSEVVGNALGDTITNCSKKKVDCEVDFTCVTEEKSFLNRFSVKENRLKSET